MPEDFPGPGDRPPDSGQSSTSKDPSLLAKAAVKLAEHYKTPPVPKVFEVWYAFLAGEPEELRRTVKHTIIVNGGISSYELEQIHDKFLDTNPDNEALRNRLLHEVGTTESLVQRQIGNNDVFAGALKRSSREISASTNAEEMQRAIDQLMHQNGKMRAETVRLSRDLETTRAIMHTLSAKLDEARRNALIDPLTRVANRRAFDQTLAQRYKTAVATGRPLSLVMADIDKFKTFNDRYGHQVGDDVLHFIGNLLNEHVGKGDFVARYGGEEFAIILFADIDGAGALAARIADALAESRLVLAKDRDPLGEITCSFGVTDTDGKDGVSAMIARADRALYAAKAAGRNCTIFNSVHSRPQEKPPIDAEVSIKVA